MLRLDEANLHRARALQLLCAPHAADDQPVLAGERAAHLTRRTQRDPYSAAARLMAGRFFVWLLAFHGAEAKREAKPEGKHKTHQLYNTSLLDEVATGHSYPSVGRRCPLFYPAPSPTPWVTRTCNGSQKVARSVHLMQTLPSSIQTGANVCRTREQSIEQTMDVVYL